MKSKNSKKAMKILKYLMVICVLTMGFSCSKDDDGLSSGHKILSFEHENLISVELLNGGMEIKINEYLTVCQMSLIWKAGTDLTSLSPVITISPKAYIIPNPNIPQDFSEQVDYTVVAEDGTGLTYLIVSRTEDQEIPHMSTFIKEQSLHVLQSAPDEMAERAITN